MHNHIILVTGGAGFIGANFILQWVARGLGSVVNLDKLTYAGNLDNLAALRGDSRHEFVRGDINDYALINTLLAEHKPRAIVHFAAESHVDRSILGPRAFVETNALGTQTLLESARSYWDRLPDADRCRFRFLHISTDEVYGSLDDSASPATEGHPYRPNSPYAASKAAADHLVRGYHRTYGLPAIISNCSNNFGPLQFPEKLIPLVITRALASESLPVYGDGGNVRDWLFVTDHCAALTRILQAGEAGECYNIGGGSEKANIDVVCSVCRILDEVQPRPHNRSYREFICFVPDRPGHDRRYALDATKIRRKLGWSPEHSFEPALRTTIDWYLRNTEWVDAVRDGRYRDWVSLNY